MVLQNWLSMKWWRKKVPDCVAIIPARGNSRGILGKNLVDLGGKPLFVWTVEAAVESGVFDRVVVTSEDKAICDIASDYFRGQTKQLASIIKRPPYLSQDHVQLSEVVLQSYRIMEHEWGWNPTTLCLLQVTSPLRTGVHIINAMRQYKGNGTLFSAYVDKKYHWIVDYSVDPVEHNPRKRMGRQWEPSRIYTENGAIYIFPAKRLSLECTIRLEPFDIYVMPEEDGWEIDNQWELDVARLRLEKYGLHRPNTEPIVG